jgi:hypothetical protein
MKCDLLVSNIACKFNLYRYYATVRGAFAPWETPRTQTRAPFIPSRGPSCRPRSATSCSLHTHLRSSIFTFISRPRNFLRLQRRAALTTSAPKYSTHAYAGRVLRKTPGKGSRYTHGYTAREPIQAHPTAARGLDRVHIYFARLESYAAINMVTSVVVKIVKQLR